MDEINILLSEVALELLGNKFYDIYGMQHDGLGHLLTTEKSAPPEGYDEKTCPLLKNISVSVFDVQDHDFEMPAPKPAKRSRRASATDVFEKPIAMEPIPINDPESLLVPMEAPSKKGIGGRINRRRFTLLDNSGSLRQRNLMAQKQSQSSSSSNVFTEPAPFPAKQSLGSRGLEAIKDEKREKRLPLLLQPDKPANISRPPDETNDEGKKDRQLPRSRVTGTTFELTTNMNNPRESAKVAQLKEQADIEFNKLIDESKKLRLDYFLTNRDLLGTSPYHSEFEIIEEFHKSEKERLMFTCNQLIEFIKFIKMDEDYADRMALIANCILKLKESM